MARKKSENGTGEQTAEGRPNQFDPAKVQNYVERIENLKADIVTTMMRAVGECKPLHEDIRSVLDEAKNEHGIPKKALKAAVKARELERKAKEVRDDLEDAEDQHSYDLIRHALGDFSTTELGQAALDAAEQNDQPNTGL